MDRRWCNACGNSFLPRPQAPRQTYCAEDACQRERKRIWQLTKRKSDPDYIDNQMGAQRSWSKRNPDYWRSYRKRHPEYEEGNRIKQRDRNRTGGSIAKMDASTASPELGAGIYQLVRQGGKVGETTEIWTVAITVLSVLRT